MSRNPKYNKLINSWDWQKLRAKKLASDPLCEECKRKGRVRAASEVHHVTPVESVTDVHSMRMLAYDWHNLMSLCHDCHRAIHENMPRRRKGWSGRTETKQQRKINMAKRAEAFASRFLPKKEENNEST